MADPNHLLLSELGAWLAPREVSRGAYWGETFALPSIAIVLAWLMRPEDPTLASATFPWLWFAPVLVALRYGVMAGLVAGALLVVNWYLTALLVGDPGPFPQSHFFGGILLTLLCGEFADLWHDRHQQLEETNLYLVERVSRLTRRHLLLNQSHDRLEQEMLVRPGSFRDALVQLRDQILHQSNNAPLPAAAKLLKILAQYTNIQSAFFYAIDPRNGRIGNPVAQLGKPEPLTEDDALWRLAQESGQLAHVADRAAGSEERTRQKVVAPLLASDQTLLGVLAVSELPFFSLNAENLQFMAIILGYYADCVHSAPAVAYARRRIPSMPVLFAEELVRLIALHKRFGINSQIVVFYFKPDQGQEIIEELLRLKRGIDIYWPTVVGETPVLVALLPFASLANKEGFLNRIENWLRSRFGGDFEMLTIAIHSIDFSRQDPVAELERLVSWNAEILVLSRSDY